MERVLLIKFFSYFPITFKMVSQRLEKAWITAITRDTYLDGAQTLAKSLRRVNSRIPLVILYTPALSQSTVDILSQEPNVQMRPIKPYKLERSDATGYAFERFAEAWNKMRCWQVDASILCWIDADMLVIKNMDDIFDLLPSDKDLAASPACICNPNKVSTYPAYWNPQNCPFSTKNQTISDKKYFNAGLLLFRPSQVTLDAFEAYINAKEEIGSWTFAEQDFLNEYYAGQWEILPYVYNALKTNSIHHADVWNLSDIRNIHYILEKPWDDRHSESPKQAPYKALNDLWWETREC